MLSTSGQLHVVIAIATQVPQKVKSVCEQRNVSLPSLLCVNYTIMHVYHEQSHTLDIWIQKVYQTCYKGSDLYSVFTLRLCSQSLSAEQEPLHHTKRRVVLILLLPVHLQLWR